MCLAFALLTYPANGRCATTGIGKLDVAAEVPANVARIVERRLRAELEREVTSAGGVYVRLAWGVPAFDRSGCKAMWAATEIGADDARRCWLETLSTGTYNRVVVARLVLVGKRRRLLTIYVVGPRGREAQAETARVRSMTTKHIKRTVAQAFAAAGKFDAIAAAPPPPPPVAPAEKAVQPGYSAQGARSGRSLWAQMREWAGGCFLPCIIPVLLFAFAGFFTGLANGKCQYCGGREKTEKLDVMDLITTGLEVFGMNELFGDAFDAGDALDIAGSGGGSGKFICTNCRSDWTGEPNSGAAGCAGILMFVGCAVALVAVIDWLVR